MEVRPGSAPPAGPSTPAGLSEGPVEISGTVVEVLGPGRRTGAAATAELVLPGYEAPDGLALVPPAPAGAVTAGAGRGATAGRAGRPALAGKTAEAEDRGVPDAPAASPVASESASRRAGMPTRRRQARRCGHPAAAGRPAPRRAGPGTNPARPHRSSAPRLRCARIVSRARSSCPGPTEVARTVGNPRRAGLARRTGRQPVTLDGRRLGQAGPRGGTAL